MLAFLGALLTNAPSPKNTPCPSVANFIFFGPFNTSTLPSSIINIKSPFSPSFIINEPALYSFTSQKVAAFFTNFGGTPANRGLFIISVGLTLIFFAIYYIEIHIIYMPKRYNIYQLVCLQFVNNQ